MQGGAEADGGAAEGKAKEIIKEGLSEYFIYTVEGTETIPNGWSKRMRSFDADGFYAAETQARREAGMPPFGRLAAIVVSSEDQAEATAAAGMIGRAAPEHENMAVFGPAPAPLAMLRGRHRLRLLVHAARTVPVQDLIRDWLGKLQWPRGVRVSVDVDPYSFL